MATIGDGASLSKNAGVCAVCLEHYHNYRDPCLVPCSHTCRACIDELRVPADDGNILCPLCRHTSCSLPPEKGANALPRNLTVGWSDADGETTSKTFVGCAVCERSEGLSSSNAASVSRHDKCEWGLYNEDSELRVLAFTGPGKHNLSTLQRQCAIRRAPREVAVAGLSNTSSVQAVPISPLHGKSHRTLCSMCEVPICVDCTTFRDRRSHKPIPYINGTVKEQSAKAEEQVNHFKRDTVEQLKCSLGAGAGGRTALMHQARQACVEIRQAHDQAIETHALAVEEHIHQRLQQVTDLKEARLKALAHRRAKEVKSRLDNGQNAIRSRTERLMQASDDCVEGEFLAFLCTLEKQISGLRVSVNTENQEVTGEENEKEEATASAESSVKHYSTTLCCQPCRNLGLAISGGLNCYPRYQHDNDYVYVTRIHCGGVADRDGVLQPGDKILEVNGVSFLSITHSDAVAVLRASKKQANITVERAKSKQAEVPIKFTVKSSLHGDFNKKASKNFGWQSSPECASDNEGEKEQDRSSVKEVGEEDNGPVEEVTINRGKEPFGFSIVGGVDHSSLPFGTHKDDTGVFISKIVPGSIADQANTLHMGDRILSVNGYSLVNVAHTDAVALLVNTPSITLHVKHDPPPEGLKEIVVEREPGEKLGLSVCGGAGAPSGNPFNIEDEGIFVFRVHPGKAAWRSGGFSPGQRIIEVNGKTLLGSTHHDALSVLRNETSPITFIVCHGYQPNTDY